MSMSALPFMGDIGQSMGGPGQLAGGPAGQPILGGVAGQTQQQIANPIYGQQSPFQPEQTAGGIPTKIGNMPAEIGSFDPVFSGGGKGGFGPGQLAGGPAGQPILGGGQPQPVPMMRNFPGYDFNGEPIPQPQPQPIHMMQNFVGGGLSGANMPLQGTLPGSKIPYAIGNEPIMPPTNRGQLAGGPAGQPFTGGLRPAPKNYRPPMRSGGILRQRLR